MSQINNIFTRITKRNYHLKRKHQWNYDIDDTNNSTLYKEGEGKEENNKRKKLIIDDDDDDDDYFGVEDNSNESNLELTNNVANVNEILDNTCSSSNAEKITLEFNNTITKTTNINTSEMDFDSIKKSVPSFSNNEESLVSEEIKKSSISSSYKNDESLNIESNNHGDDNNDKKRKFEYENENTKNVKYNNDSKHVEYEKDNSKTVTIDPMYLYSQNFTNTIMKEKDKQIEYLNSIIQEKDKIIEEKNNIIIKQNQIISELQLNDKNNTQFNPDEFINISKYQKKVQQLLNFSKQSQKQSQQFFIDTNNLLSELFKCKPQTINSSNPKNEIVLSEEEKKKYLDYIRFENNSDVTFNFKQIIDQTITVKRVVYENIMKMGRIKNAYTRKAILDLFNLKEKDLTIEQIVEIVKVCAAYNNGKVSFDRKRLELKREKLKNPVLNKPKNATNSRNYNTRDDSDDSDEYENYNDNNNLISSSIFKFK